MSNLKRVNVLGGSSIAAAIVAKMAESQFISVTAPSSYRENPPRETRKERRARERYEAKMLKRESK